MKKVLLAVLVCIAVGVGAQPKPAYQIFDIKGKKSDFGKMIEDLKDADVVFYGEYHNDPISHWLEYEVTEALHKAREGKLILGAEMFETDNQLIIDEYLAGIISLKKFEAECRLWPNYSTDYEPVFGFAKDNKLKFIATNVPRRYASMVYKKGKEMLEKLSPEALKYIAPLPIEFAQDTSLANMGPMSVLSKNPKNLSQSQDLKDATMAYFINKNYENGKMFIHYNGSFHSDNRSGIIKYLLKLNPDLKIKVISTGNQEEVSELDEAYQGIADYVVCIPYTMVKTY
jgi:uncharacterized iron-regulated protein